MSGLGTWDVTWERCPECPGPVIPDVEHKHTPFAAQGFTVECTTGGLDCACNTHRELFCDACESAIEDGQMIRAVDGGFAHVDCKTVAPMADTELAEVTADRDRARAVAVALEQELAEIRSAFREVLELHEQPPREDVDGLYPWFSGDIGLDEMATYEALLGDGS